MAKKKIEHEAPNVGDLGEVSKLARALIDAEDAVTSAEEALKLLREHERAIREEDLPGAMEELGLKKITLSSGEVISTKLEVYASISEAMKGPAYKWLDDNGFGGLIKTEVKAEFGREELEEAKALLAELEGQQYDCGIKQAVAPQTLKAWLKEQLQLGVNAKAQVPLELFGARPVNQASVKRVK